MWSEKSDHRCFRSQLGLIITALSAFESDHNPSPAYLALIIGGFERTKSDQMSILAFFSIFSNKARVKTLLRAKKRYLF